jgi:pyruvate dehydrogenase E2 component (dihydrolipoamide acetyltransferase)
VEDGLLVPVIQQAQLKRLADIQAELNTTVELARTRNLPPQKLSNGTFTVTNLGHVGIDAFVPTISRPQTASRGGGRVAEQMVVVGGQPAVRPMARVCVVFDHRATEGVPAASCLARIKELLENPYLLA